MNFFADAREAIYEDEKRRDQRGPRGKVRVPRRRVRVEEGKDERAGRPPEDEEDCRGFHDRELAWDLGDHEVRKHRRF